MYIDIVPNRNSPPAVLLREAWREGGRVCKRTLANLSSLPREQVELIRRVLRGERLVPVGRVFQIVRACPHGHVAAVVGTMQRLGLPELVSTRRHRKRQLVLAMMAARVIEPCSKLATARQLGRDTLSHSLGSVLGVEEADADDLYEALDWLVRSQARIEKKLAERHLGEGHLVLWDVTAVAFESRTCPLAVRGRPGKGKRESPLQLLFGLLTTPDGLPVAVEVFPGNAGDPSTVSTALDRVQGRFGLKRVVLVGDRGMLTEARITEELRPRQLDWITALRAPTIRQLVEEGPLQLSLFDRQDLVEITSPDFPGERLIACYNPLLAEERARKRAELVAATEKKLAAVVEATRRAKRPLRGQDRIGVRVGKILGASKVGKHFRYEIRDEGFTFEKDEASIAREAKLDGLYVLRTSVSAQALEAPEVVRAYKGLSVVEQAFRVCKDFALEVEPIRHRREERVRAHVFLCMLAFYVWKHMERALAPLLFADHDREGAEQERRSVVAPATRSAAAKRKLARKRSEEGHPLHAFATLLKDLATLTQNTVRVADSEITVEQYSQPTALQERAFELLGVSYRL